MNLMMPNERPRERCLRSGPNCLSLRECLALIFGSGPPGKGALGLAAQILSFPGDGLSPGEEEAAFFAQMESALKTENWNFSCHLGNSGLGPAYRARLLASLEIGRRFSIHLIQREALRGKDFSRNKMETLALSRIPDHLRCSSREWIGFVPMKRSGEIGELGVVENGVRTHVNTDPIELFARILVLRPRGFFLFHNHPANTLRPSTQDIELTLQVRETAQLLGLIFFGHWIVAPSGEVAISEAM